jgi:hypothetical protein
MFTLGGSTPQHNENFGSAEQITSSSWVLERRLMDIHRSSLMQMTLDE